MSHDHPAAPLTTYRLTFIPDYRLIFLNDQDNDAGPGASGVLNEAAQDVAASDGYTLVITVAQDLLPVGVTVTISDTEPHPAPGVPQLRLECPSGQLALGSPTGGGIPIHLVPGTYAATVEHHGRDTAATRRQEILHQYTSPDDLEALRNATPPTEQYTITMWRTGDIDDTEDDD
ncbi:hypothetical protein [Amycolatopsis alba]|uniref:Uncharacterized protein n=1 Tax=Amycolatopsis alba DSM 44262 TaxID=1125972 RepID=A0A229REC6_AMYAL|nr:hypothetical protein [Amycolatopsis alba]OXM44811.1 hypothetical protein CFP75_33355 [Amycolatopsis alba DSM 44262]